MSVLIDTSVWIDYFNGNEESEIDLMQDLLISDQVCVCPTIVQEVLQGTVSDKYFNTLNHAFTGVKHLIADPYEMAIEAAELFRFLRRKGITIRKSNDCLIACYGLFFRIPIWHRDRDFNHIAQYFPLKIYR